MKLKELVFTDTDILQTLYLSSSLLLTILEENVEQDDADLVICADVGVQQDWHDGPHGVFDLLSLSVCAHSQILEQRQTLSYVCHLNGHLKASDTHFPGTEKAFYFQ